MGESSLKAKPAGIKTAIGHSLHNSCENGEAVGGSVPAVCADACCSTEGMSTYRARHPRHLWWHFLHY
uniref:Uncharacterized protein n=1 Tax=Coptotermes formosanus TaxID=36987 RepID=R4V2X1_COPFO|nr:hypothetical protein [Coptotermes formosanus]